MLTGLKSGRLIIETRKPGFLIIQNVSFPPALLFHSPLTSWTHAPTDAQEPTQDMRTTTSFSALLENRIVLIVEILGDGRAVLTGPASSTGQDFHGA